MKLEDAKTEFYDSSGTLSDSTRNLLLVGIAVIWMFKAGDKDAAGITFSRTLLFPLGAFVIGLLLDILQYLYKTVAWVIFYNAHHTKQIADDAEVNTPKYINYPAYLFFGLKVLACGYGYFCVVEYIYAAL